MSVSLLITFEVENKSYIMVWPGFITGFITTIQSKKERGGNKNSPLNYKLM